MIFSHCWQPTELAAHALTLSYLLINPLSLLDGRSIHELVVLQADEHVDVTSIDFLPTAQPLFEESEHKIQVRSDSEQIVLPTILFADATLIW